MHSAPGPHAPPAQVVIFGASGDLTMHKLMPALASLELKILKIEPPRSNPPLFCLEFFMLVLLLGIGLLLDTAIGGNFLEAPVWETLNVMENLVGIPPIVDIKDDITLAHIMSKLENIELKMSSMSKRNEVDRRIQGNLKRLDSSMHEICKTLETLKSHDLDPSRMDKIEDIFETLGTTLFSIKRKKVETPAGKQPKFVYVPKVPQPKMSIPIAKGVETVKTAARLQSCRMTATGNMSRRP